MADVFLSYARPSLNHAMRVANGLRAAGFSVWFDESLPAHRPYTDVIAEELDAAAAVLVLWSKDAGASQWVRSEANRARETGRLVQLRLDDARLPMPFDQIQCADLRGWTGGRETAGWHSVLASISALTTGERSPEPVTTLPPPQTNRRRLLLAGGATGLLAAGGVAWWLSASSPMSAEATLLLQKGMDALQANDALDPEDAGSTGQAIALLTQATSAAPESSDAWGGLALAYAVRRRASGVADRPGLEARGRAAAKTALRLDPIEPRALAAVQIMDPIYRNWSTAERTGRSSLNLNPRFPILLFVLSDVLGSVGRWREATELSNRLDRRKFLLPGAERKAILNLWASGDLQGADEAMAGAVARWPDQRQVWRTRIAYLLYSGRASEALPILRDRSTQPRDLLPGMVEAATATARALTGEIGRAEAIADNLAYLRTNPVPALAVMHGIAAMGDRATVMALLNGYYFGEGEWATLAPPGGDQDRQTSPLFQPPMKGMWQGAEFEQLLRRIGLTDYWAETRTVPDYRRG